MSHYTVLVVGDEPETQLEPFFEQTEDKQYLEFFDAEKEYFEEYNSGEKTSKEWYSCDNMWLSKKEYKHLIDSGKLTLIKHAPDRYFCSGRFDRDGGLEFKKNTVTIEEWDEDKGSSKTETYAEVTDWKREYTDDFKEKLMEDLKKSHPKELEEAYKILADRLVKEEEGFYVYEATLKLIDPPREIPLKETYPNYTDYLTDWHGSEKDEEQGKYGHWRNPNAKWDWYQLGGRWSGTFTLKNGDSSDQALKSEIDFNAMEAKQRTSAEEHWLETEEMIAEAEKSGKNIKWELNFQYGRKDNMTREEYIKDSVGFHSFAVLKDGKWYEKGEMGWWACVSNEKDPDAWERELNKLLTDTPDDTLLSMYDCHI